MRTWRERIVDGAVRTDAYRNMMRGGSSDARAIGYAVRCMAEDAADDLQRELDADCDPVALAQRQAQLALLTAWLTFDSVLVPLVQEGVQRGLITEAQGRKLLDLGA